MIKPFEIIAHTADLRIKSSGKTIEELFTNVARGMFYVMGGKDFFRQKVSREKLKKIKIEISADSLESLLVNFLNELIYQSEILDMVGQKIKISKLSPEELKTEAYFIEAPKILDIKAATFYNLTVVRPNNYYEVAVVYDI